jgi:hypothetical protein
MHHPRERKVAKETQEEITKMVKLGGNRKLIQQHVSETTGKLVTKKDIDNMLLKKKPDNGKTSAGAGCISAVQLPKIGHRNCFK